MRHAKSDWHSNASSDFDRPLNKRGKNDANRMGKYLLLEGFVPDQVIASPACRASQTVRRACEQMGIDEDAIHYEDSLYLAGVEKMLSILAGIGHKVGRLMLVSHNPGVDDLLRYLCKTEPAYNGDGKLMTTAACAIIDLPDNWQEDLYHCGILVNLARPRELQQ